MRVTKVDVDNCIKKETYVVLENGRTTVCQLSLFKEDGFTVEGISSCIDINNFDIGIGKSIAKERAIEKVFDFLAFKLWFENN